LDSKKYASPVQTEGKLQVRADAILDGDPSTAWHQSNDKKMPIDLVIGLGKEQNICGFRYFPDQALWGPGIITDYQFYVSDDNIE
jgi:alpha-L-fucosidase